MKLTWSCVKRDNSASRSLEFCFLKESYDCSFEVLLQGQGRESDARKIQPM